MHEQRAHLERDLLRFHGKAVAHEVVIHPVAVQVVNEHAELEFFGRNELDHDGKCVKVLQYPAGGLGLPAQAGQI